MVRGRRTKDMFPDWHDVLPYPRTSNMEHRIKDNLCNKFASMRSAMSTDTSNPTQNAPMYIPQPTTQTTIVETE